jgi:hypothetical protein
VPLEDNIDLPLGRLGVCDAFGERTTSSTRGDMAGALGAQRYHARKMAAVGRSIVRGKNQIKAGKPFDETL